MFARKKVEKWFKNDWKGEGLSTSRQDLSLVFNERSVWTLIYNGIVNKLRIFLFPIIYIVEGQYVT